jgi:hypothetical protein
MNAVRGHAAGASPKRNDPERDCLATVTLRVKFIARRDGEPVFVCLILEMNAGAVKNF